MSIKKRLKSAMLAFSAGAAGGLLNSIVVFLLARAGLEAAFGVTSLGEWSLSWIYPRMVWGGILAFLFLIPLFSHRWASRGLLWSIVPTIPSMLVMFPGQNDIAEAVAMSGESPVVVVLVTLVCVYALNAIWGLMASYLYEVGEKSP